MKYNRLFILILVIFFLHTIHTMYKSVKIIILECILLGYYYYYIDFNGQISTELPILTGVPTVSALGPLLFIVFTILMYANSTTLYCNVNTNVTDGHLNCELSEICDWLGANQIAKKCNNNNKCMAFF